MTEAAFDRRALLAATGLLAAALPVAAQPAAFAPKPLPLNPKAVPGLSEKLLISHHDNNYVGAVKRLGAIRAEFGKLDFATASMFQMNGLKREELIAWNSMILHELYFAGLAARAAPSTGLAQALERDFGSHDRWAGEFTAMGKALGGGSGWVLLTYSRHDGRLVNTWASDHTQTLADGAPLLALDMYEHAYALDYGAKAADYVDAFMNAMTWSEANRRFVSASRA
ncbi:MAG: Fe-Mn family superoxide dismutase [Phenylobacterium sp.]|uniref:superoxide dismutase n=1 Tax=Phenylobacterium sp. TaxID=1871053 RepID=UPI002734EB9E|nr:Fe-Mn family superoxide dismutase [Phenylobacterium sp.]MDP3747782.1 Fe-Mn family superoxide dismutase [Phenylobacterium sp.]